MSPETATSLCGFLVAAALGLEYAGDLGAAACCRRAAHELELDWWSYNHIVAEVYQNLSA